MIKNIAIFLIIITIIKKDNIFTTNIKDLVKFYKDNSIEFSEISDLSDLIDEIKRKKIVLLGESTHGTSDFYNLRLELSKNLIETGDFNFVAIEGDWGAIYKLNLFVNQNKSEKKDFNKNSDLIEVYNILNRYYLWPRWIWVNKETANFILWLKNYNLKQPDSKKVGIYGFDLYGYQKSNDMLKFFFKKYFSEKFINFSSDLDCIYKNSENCVQKLDNIINFLQERFYNKNDNLNSKKLFYAFQTAHIVKYGYQYFLKNSKNNYRWNIRTENFYKILINLLNYYGENSKTIIWAHNNHIGDLDGVKINFGNMKNLRELLKNSFKKSEIFSIGLTTESGDVIATKYEGDEPKIFKISTPIPNSFEDILGKTGFNKLYTPLYKLKSEKNIDLKSFNKSIWHRAFGVVYNYKNEKYHYAPIIPHERYDAIIFIKKSSPIDLEL